MDKSKYFSYIIILLFLASPVVYAQKTPGGKPGHTAAQKAGAKQKNKAIKQKGKKTTIKGTEKTQKKQAETLKHNTLTQKERKYYENLVRQYRAAGISTLQGMAGVLQVEIMRREKDIERAYAAAAKEPENEVRKRRIEAIKTLEDFLKKYPNNPTYTPEVMMRLADLYYDRSFEAFLDANDAFDRKMALYEKGKIPARPKPPQKDYTPSIKLYVQLLKRFPNYRMADVAEYLLGYCYEDMGIDEKAMQAYTALVTRYPKSKMRGAAWMRLGEYYFDMGEWVKAQHAYQKVLENPKSKWYTDALYKLSWSYFQNNEYPTAIASFKRFIEYLDAGHGKGSLGAQLRDEAVEYLAYSLADDDWDGDGEPDPDAGVQRALSYLSEGKPYEREVLIKYADRLFAERTKEKFQQAIKAYRSIMMLYPGHPDNPLLEEKIVLTYQEMGEWEKATEEREKLIKDFGPGSAWYAKNKAKPIAMARVERQIQLALYNAAALHKKRASDLRKKAESTPGDLVTMAKAIGEYNKAAEEFKLFLKRYPSNPNNYDITLWLADSLYYSLHYIEAAKYYAKVRDWKGKDKYRELAGFSVIFSYEKAIEKAIKSGQLTPSDRPGEMGPIEEVSMPNAKTKIKVPEQPLPELTKKWIAAVDRYVKLGLNRPNDPHARPKLMYRVALELYKRRHLAEARKRFAQIIKEYPKEVVASYAAANIINSYRLENDWAGIQKWAKKLEALHLGKPEERAKLAAQIKIFQLGAAFKGAAKLFKQKKYEAAAKAFIKVVDQDPGAKFADKALYNAAIAYIQVKKYDSATKVLTRLVTDPRYQKSSFIESSLATLAETARKFFNFQAAVNAYQTLLTRFPDSKYAKAALYQSAFLNIAMGKYEEAARLLEKYSRVYETDKNAVNAMYAAAIYMKKAGNLSAAVKYYREFIRRFGDRPDQGQRVIEALWNMAKIAKRMRNRREYRRLLDKIVSEYNKLGLPAGSKAADYVAQIVFNRIEPKYKRYKAIDFSGSLKQAGRKIKEKKRLLAELEKDYSQVLVYKSGEWSSAAVYRLAEIYELFAQALFDAPVPAGFNEEQQDMYKDQLDQFAQPLQKKALTRYKVMVEEARKNKLINKWVKKAWERLNSYEPQNYPLVKEGKVMPVDHEVAVPQLGRAR